MRKLPLVQSQDGARDAFDKLPQQSKTCWLAQCQQLDYRRGSRFLQNADAGLLKRSIGIAHQLGQRFAIDFRDGMADDAGAFDAAIITASMKTAFVATLPKAQIALPAERFHFAEA